MLSLDDLLAAQRAERAALEAQAAARLVTAYGQAWQAIERDLRALTEAIDAARTAGEEVTPAWLAREERHRALMAQVEGQINGLAAQAGPLVRQQQATAIAAAARHAEELARATLGTPPPGIAVAWNRAPVEAVRELVGTLADGTPLGELLAAFGPDARAAAEKALTTGLLRGYHPTRIARDLSGAVEQMGQVRALRLARSAMLDAYRDSTLAQYRQNDIITGYRRLAAHGSRTCLACLALSGRVYPLGQDFSRHPACRCTLAPVTKTWKEIVGVDIPQPPPPETGAAWFARQPEATRQLMLGPGKYTAFRQGVFVLSELAEETTHPVWGAGLRERPLGYFVDTAARRAGTFRKFATPELADEWGQAQYRAWVAKLKPDEREALDLFKGAHSKDVNHYLRGITEEHDAKLGKKLTGQIDKALRKSSVPENVTVYRGMRPEAFGGVIDPIDPGKLRGLVLSDKGFAATSLSEETARGGYGIHGILAEIRVPKGTKAAYLDTSGIHQYAYREYEMLLPRGTRFKVVGARKEGNTTRLILEVLDAE